MPKSFTILPSFLRNLPVYQIVHINPELNIANPSSGILDLGVYKSSNCTFDFHVTKLFKRYKI